jgi:hypothetical protein
MLVSNIPHVGLGQPPVIVKPTISFNNVTPEIGEYVPPTRDNRWEPYVPTMQHVRHLYEEDVDMTAQLEAQFEDAELLVAKNEALT